MAATALSVCLTAVHLPGKLLHSSWRFILLAGVICTGRRLKRWARCRAKGLLGVLAPPTYMHSPVPHCSYQHAIFADRNHSLSVTTYRSSLHIHTIILCLPRWKLSKYDTAGKTDHVHWWLLTIYFMPPGSISAALTACKHVDL